MRKFVLCFLACAGMALADSTWTGYVSEVHCGAVHNKPSAANSKCIAECLAKGFDLSLVEVNGTMHKFTKDSSSKVKPYAGQMVVITGTASGDYITVNTITAQQ